MIHEALSVLPLFSELMKEASANGSPLMRTMFYEFPKDERCWKIEDQYMFGDKYLVAPVLNPSQASRTVYLPTGKWKHIFTGKEYEGGTTITVETPIENIPVFEKL